MDVTKQNLKVFEDGIALALKKSRSVFLDFGSEIVTELVKKAVEDYSKHKASLTGNLLNSIAGGIYINGRIARIIHPNIAPETHTYTYVGDGVFQDYDDPKNTVYFVFQYRKPLEFQKVDGTGTGYDSAVKFLESYTPKSKVFEIVICAAAPYAEYLQEKRQLDVLTTANMNKRRVWDMAKKNINVVQI